MTFGCDREELRRELVMDEGNKPNPYLCPSGALTIGIGHNLDASPLPPHIVDALYDWDVAQAASDLDRTDPGWREHPDEVQRALINLMFNLGASRWSKFVATRAALARKDYAAAADGLIHSKWAKQVQRSRRDRIVRQFRQAGAASG